MVRQAAESRWNTRPWNDVRGSARRRPSADDRGLFPQTQDHLQIPIYYNTQSVPGKA